jgi:von Willebrand factor type A domain-containing protein
MDKVRVSRVVLIWILAFASLAKAQTQTDFFIQDIQVNPDSSVTIIWPTVPQMTYHVMYADSPTDTWQDFPDGKLSAGSNVWSLCYTDTNTLAATQRFYKVRITRVPVVMTLVLDTSGSMGVSPPSGSGGGAFLPNAVTTFINDFDEMIDKVAMVKFSTIQQNVFYGGSPSQPTQPFKNTIIADVNAFTYNGSTFSQGGLTNALVLENNATISPSQNVAKVVVFFTDGLANLIQDTFSCPPATTMNFGGLDQGTGVEFFNPSSGSLLCSLNNGGAPPCCSAVSQFTSAIDGSLQPFIRAYVSADATYRAVAVANQMRANGIAVYSIGVGTGVDLTFLQQVANDPNAPGYIATPYDGEAVIANDPSQLSAVFQSIALKLMYQ